VAGNRKKERWRRLGRTEDAPTAREDPRRRAAGRRERFGRSLAELLDLPEDVILNVPRITIVGNLQMIIENHRGLIEYSPGFIRVGIADGQMSISGRDLAVGSVFAETLTVMGEFRAVIFDRGGAGEHAAGRPGPDGAGRPGGVSAGVPGESDAGGGSPGNGAGP